MDIKIIKFDEKLITPKREHHNDSGLDCYALNDIFIPAHSNPVKIKLGFGLELPDGVEAQVRGRSSLNSKGLLTYLGTVDAGYKGEICAVMSNLTEQDIFIPKRDKICQIVIAPVIYVNLKESFESERNDGGFGSTDEKFSRENKDKNLIAVDDTNSTVILTNIK